MIQEEATERDRTEELSVLIERRKNAIRVAERRGHIVYLSDIEPNQVLTDGRLKTLVFWLDRDLEAIRKENWSDADLLRWAQDTVGSAREGCCGIRSFRRSTRNRETRDVGGNE